MSRERPFMTAEARLLDETAGALPVAVPEIVFVDTERGCLACRKLSGTPLLQQPRASRAAWADAIATTVGRSLAAMHALSPARMAEFVGTDDAPLAEWHADATTIYRGVAATIPATDRPRARRDTAFRRRLGRCGDARACGLLCALQRAGGPGLWTRQRPDAIRREESRCVRLVVRGIVGGASTTRLDLVAWRILALTHALLTQP